MRVSCVYRYLRVILKNNMCEKMLGFVRKLVVMLCKRFILRKSRLGVLDEYVELCDLCLRFVFWGVVHFLGAISKIGNGELSVFSEAKFGSKVLRIEARRSKVV